MTIKNTPTTSESESESRLPFYPGRGPGKVLARNARLFWDMHPPQIVVVPLGQPTPGGLPYSGGACYTSWRNVKFTGREVEVELLRVFRELTLVYGLDPVMVDKALAEIVEYQGV